MWFRVVAGMALLTALVGVYWVIGTVATNNRTGVVPSAVGHGRLAGECRLAARPAGYPIACPSSLPVSARPFWGNGFQRGECSPGACGKVVLARWVYFGTYFRRAGELRHLVVLSAPTVVSAQRLIYLVGTVRPHPSSLVTLIRRTRVGTNAAWFVHPSLDPSLDPPPHTGGVIFLGDTVLVWHASGHTYAIGITGPDPQQAEATLSKSIRFVAQAT
jgi:hypothetical protein